MNTRIIASIFGSCSLVILFTSNASAQVQRAFVSGLGSDSNPCSRPAPCRTFVQAISQTNSGGEVIVLDSAGYGAFSIAKPVSITSAPGVYAGISVFSGDGIDINAGASDTVILRGLTVNNQGSGGSGIVFNSGGTLHVESCVINGFSGFPNGGLRFLGPGSLEVKDSIMRGNDSGIIVAPSSGTARATIDEVLLEGGVTGLECSTRSVVTVRKSVASANSGVGFAVGASKGTARLSLEGCVASNNGGGIHVVNGGFGLAELYVERCVVSGNPDGGVGANSANLQGAAGVWLSNSTVTGNGTGLSTDINSTIFSRGNNTVEGNTTDTSANISSYSAK